MNDERPRLEMYPTRAVLFQSGMPPEPFAEGPPLAQAKARLRRIKDRLDAGYLTALIQSSQRPGRADGTLEERHRELLLRLVDSVASEVSRAIIGLTVLQLCVKAIEPRQNIRLHKASETGRQFSWAEGIPMRVLDRNYITPILRQFNLLKLSVNGFMTTHLLTKDYPYSQLYNAGIRGARAEWLELVDLIEAGAVKPEPALRHLIGLLFNRSDKFKRAAEAAMLTVRGCLPKLKRLDDAIRFIREFVDNSSYSARVFEIALHALFQVLAERKVFGGVLKPLCQMRSANKKHGNIGDIEIVKKAGGLEILEAWDAKYGKSDLYDELNEINEKLEDHSETEVVGFVVNAQPSKKADIQDRVREIEQLHEVEVHIQGFEEWVNAQLPRAIGADHVSLGRQWVVAFAESLCQMRRDVAPIDEPADAWVAALADHATSWEG